MPRPYQSKENNPVKAVILLLLALLALWMLLSPYGLWQYSKISRELASLKAENSRLEQENRDLLIEIEKLRNDPEYIEEVARRQHGLLKKNEMIFNFSR
ncbi:MAG TPA: septum formation initiator family protein [Desulfurivibrio alkaliphilus]|uniref:Septum formation initiator family protein n=1 Tax=Desulfurivibrio alkaliphilus TaxID=427923 RepID=A0A7C2XGU1_9BACT|nr:septum formation initiator family protein [Desulfurivibrio alkaliphilus]